MSLSVLYVEDDDKSRYIMQILLGQLDASPVYLFENSKDFEAKIDQLPQLPDIVFLDIHVKPLSGFEMLKILRARPEFAKRPIVALTASVMSEEVDQLRHSGFNGVIAKPIRVETFPETIQQFLSGEEIWGIIN